MNHVHARQRPANACRVKSMAISLQKGPLEDLAFQDAQMHGMESAIATLVYVWGVLHVAKKNRMQRGDGAIS